MFKSFQLQLSLAASLSAVTALPAVKREISDAHSSSLYSSFPLTVTATLGSGSFSPLAYAGSLGNLYARDDYGYTDTYGYYEYPQYALGYGGYEPYTADAPRVLLLEDEEDEEEEVDDDAVRSSYYDGLLRGFSSSGNLDYGFKGLPVYPYHGYYGSSLQLRPSAFNAYRYY